MSLFNVQEVALHNFVDMKGLLTLERGEMLGGLQMRPKNGHTLAKQPNQTLKLLEYWFQSPNGYLRAAQ